MQQLLLSKCLGLFFGVSKNSTQPSKHATMEYGCDLSFQVRHAGLIDSTDPPQRVEFKVLLVPVLTQVVVAAGRPSSSDALGNLKWAQVDGVPHGGAGQLDYGFTLYSVPSS